MLKYLMKIIKAVNANTHPGDIGHAFAMAWLIAVVPKATLLWVFLFMLSVIIRSHKAAFVLSLLGFSFLVPLLDPGIEGLGYIILTLPALQGVWTALYALPVAGLLRFNNTLVAGGFAAGAVLYLPVYLLARICVVQYRTHLLPLIIASPLYKAFLKLPLIRLCIKAAGAAQ